MKDSDPDPIREFASYLKNSRVLMNISFEELARYSRISKSHLRGLEDGNPDEYLNKTYARGFIKAYADCIGLDIDDTLSRYNDALNSYLEMNRMNILRRYKKVIILSLIISAVLITAFFILPEPGIKNEADSPEKSTGVPADHQTSSESSIREQKDRSDLNTLKISSSGAVVISVISEQGIIMEEIIMPDECRIYEFSEYIIFSVSDISKTNIIYNGKDIKEILASFCRDNVLVNYKLESDE